MLPEWGRLVTVVKLNRGLKTSNYDQLYAYLKQHETHANENKIMLERYTQHAIDPLAFVSNVFLQQYPTQSSVIPQSAYVPPITNQSQFADNTHLDSGLTPTDDLIENLTKTVDKLTLLMMMWISHRYKIWHSMWTRDPILIYDEAGPSYSNILAEDNAEQVVQSNVTSVPNDALMMIINDMQEHAAQCISVKDQNKVVNESLTAELARYKEQVKIYEKRARFELTEREQKIDEQLRIIITDHNIQEESFKKELYSIKMQLNSTPDHNKLMKEEVATLKKDFKQKENKYLEDFLDMKELKEKVEDKLFKQDYQDQSCLEDTLELEGKRGFEQTKECYLTEVIPFFKTVKEYFVGIQTAFIKEVKEIKEIFEQIEAEVEQNDVDKKCTEIERKNLLIENENLIADCLSNELTIVKLEVEISKLKHKIQKDDHSEMIKQFSNLEVDYLNLQLKYQHLKDRLGNNKSQTSLDAPEFDSFFEINKLKEKLQGKDNTIRKLKVQISHMNERRSEADRILDFKALDLKNIEPNQNMFNASAKTILSVIG
ncbi:hypothetical protein Tco_0139277 [Tanacetum coccineum]